MSARLDGLFGGGAIHVEIDLSALLFGFHSGAYVWSTVAPGDLETAGHALSLHPETGSAAAVTGAASPMAVVNYRDTEEPYRFVTTKVGALPAVRQAEVVPVLLRVEQAGTRCGATGRGSRRAGSAGARGPDDERDHEAEEAQDADDHQHLGRQRHGPRVLHAAGGEQVADADQRHAQRGDPQEHEHRSDREDEGGRTRELV
ncbi:MAG: Lrp/AsnC ligand binding domain-containing protein [Pseudonocardia sp.]|nr:Lrp/AsnC ligand binding domain-containing protein [Pseudonocardia sp.]